jgi:patatin-like phospholipase/acyl hydrolase
MAFQILALSGGGYRGLFTARVLTRLEESAGRPLHECFDLIAGTSIGGIIAIGLAMGKPAKAIEEAFIQRGERIFPDGEPVRWWHPWRYHRAVRQLFRPKYDGVELRKAIEAILEPDLLLGAAKTRLIVPAVNMTKGSVQIFKTAHHPTLVLDKLRKAADVAMATSAAPFFFPMATLGDAFFIDGGVFANAPDLCAIHEATNFLSQRQEDIKLLSIGTTTTRFSLPSSKGPQLGVLRWIKNQRFISTIFSAQQQMVDFLLTHTLRENYLRIDATPSQEQTVDLGLDLATPARRKTLLGLAEGAFQNVAGSPKLTGMLSHKPEPPIFYN